MNKNKKLIRDAITLLKKVDKRTVKYKNTFRYVVGELTSIHNDYKGKKIND